MTDPSPTKKLIGTPADRSLPIGYAAIRLQAGNEPEVRGCVSCRKTASGNLMDSPWQVTAS